jgi:molybdopterin converting factor small subunit
LVSSDRKFKKDITHLENSLDLIMKLKPCTYNYATNNNWGINFSDGKQYGFIAQEVEEVIPELVKEIHKPAMANKDHEIVKEAVDYKAVNYDGFIPVLVKAVQELQTQNENQSKLIEELNEKIAMLSNNQTPTKQETTLGDGNVILLDQNVPNPFSDKTVIAYNIPPQAQSAYIHFYTNDGKLIQKTLLTQKGRGEITVYANSLANGNYTYSLVVDGRTIDSKRMTLNH